MEVRNSVIEIPEWYTDVDGAGFGFYGSIVVVPKNIKNLYNIAGAMGTPSVVLYFTDRDDIPHVESDLANENIDIVIPDKLYDEWSNSSNWVSARNIIKHSDYGDL